MDDLAVGRLLRSVRVRRRLRQSDLADAAGVSRQTVSRLERGGLGGTPVDTLRAVCAALGIRMSVELRGPGGELDRLTDAGHAGMHDVAARRFASLAGWILVPEATFSIYGERGAIDILAWHAPTRSLLVIELKTELVDLQNAMGGLDRKVRLARTIARERGWEPVTVSSWLLVADSRTNRRRVADHATVLRSRFPADGTLINRWLAAPSGTINALSFMSSAPGMGPSRRLAPTRRVRVAGSRSPG